ncbi:MAG: hypothetical protein AAF845_05220 [Bacteroidota bacterium]
MAQYIYLVLAILVLGILGATANRAIGGNQTRQALNETQSLVAAVGTEMLDAIGRSWFDRFMVENANPGLPPGAGLCGRPTYAEADRLADYGAFDTTSRRWIEGYHGLDTTLTRGGFAYDLAVRVRYVPDGRLKTSEDDTLAVQSFAKEAVVEVTNPYFEVGGRPLTLTMARTYTFGCPTAPSLVPRPRSGGVCPPAPCARP